MARPTVRDVHVDAAMSEISIGYGNTQYIADQVFPVVTVQKKSDVYYIFDKSSWFRSRATPRAPGTRANRVDYALSTASYIALPYAVAVAVPDEVRDNADMALKPDIEATEFATDGLLLDQEIRVANLITACSNWANASNPGTKWDNDTSDPFGDIDTIQNAVLNQTGRLPNIAVLSWPVWLTLRNHPDFIDRVKHTRAGGRVEVADLLAWFNFDKVLVGMAIQDTAKEGATSNMSAIWGDMFWAGIVPPNPSLRTPAAGYVFEWGNRKVERFREEQEHQDIFSVEHHTDEVITASDAGGIMSDCLT